MKLQPKRYPLSIKLITLFIAVALIFLFLIGWAFKHSSREGFRDIVRPHLLKYLEYIQTEIGNPPDLARLQSLTRRLPGDVQVIGPHLNWSTSEKPIKLDALHTHRRFRVNGINYRIGRYHGEEYLVSSQGDYELVFSIPFPGREGHRSPIFPLLLLILLVLLLYYGTRRIIAPVIKLKQGIQRIGAGDLQHRIQLERRDELGDLGQSIDKMADEIQNMLEAKRQLLLAISHELRSPLTRAKVSTEMINDETSRNRLHRDLNEMERLIAELLESERLSDRHQTLKLERVDLVSLVSDLNGEAFADRDIELTLPRSPVNLQLDSTRIRLMLRNLIDNALRYTPVGRPPVEVRLNLEPERIILAIKDYGAGIAPEHLPHLTEPFYRADPSRRRQTGGYGLGLYLCRMIAEAHGGTLDISSEVGTGTTVSFILPCQEAVRE